MAGYFKKRRTAGPSKNEQKLQRAESADRMRRQAGVVGNRFPAVQRLTLNLEISDPQGHLLEQRTLAMKANDPAALTVPCPGRCGQGSFDLSGGIARAVDSRQTSSECTGTCPAPLYGTSDPCGCVLRCRVEIEFSPTAQPL